MPDFSKPAFFDNASIGRVTVDPEYRDRKWGHDLMENAIAGILEHFWRKPNYHRRSIIS